MNVCGVPPDGVIVTVACRLVVALLAAADHCTEPPPVPDAPAVIVNHVWLLTAVHGKAPSVVVRDIDPVPPVKLTFVEGGLTTSTPPDCIAVRVTVGAPGDVTVTVAERATAEGLAVALYDIVPFPV